MTLDHIITICFQMQSTWSAAFVLEPQFNLGVILLSILDFSSGDWKSSMLCFT